MRFIGALNTKGGTGKTTLTSCLAVCAAIDGKVAICDLDPQGSLSDWYRRRGSPSNPHLLTGADLASDAAEALRLTSDYDYVFFDGPPGSLLVTEDCIQTCDFVVIPMRASGFDLGASQDCIQLCQDLHKPFLIVLNDAGQRDKKLVETIRSEIFSWNVPIADCTIQHRVAYITGAIVGKTGAEKDAKGAGPEIDGLWREILTSMKAAKERAA